MRYFIAILFSSVVSFMAVAENFTISGFIKDAGNGESLLGASVYVQETQKGTVTNQYGFYSITLPEGDYTLRYRLIGYADVFKKIKLANSIKIDLELGAQQIEMKEISIAAERADKNVSDTKMGTTTLEVKGIAVTM
jgi:hypothetical protein